MQEERLPKRLLYDELLEGNRSAGGQRKRYKSALKVSLNNFDIDPDISKEVADDRPSWRSLIAKGAISYEEDCLTRDENKRRQRKTFSVKAWSHQVNTRRTREERAEKMVCAPLFVVIRYSFVERAAPTFLIRDHSFSCVELRAHVQNCAELDA